MWYILELHGTFETYQFWSIEMNMKARRLAMLAQADLYCVITNEFCSGRKTLDILKGAADGGIRIVQLREKSLEARELANLACEFRKVCDAYGILMIMNDRVDIAVASGADGVHLGQSDLPTWAARKLDSEIIIGRSTHSIEQALEAKKDGADYVNLGPLLPTQTKKVAIPPLGMEILEQRHALDGMPFSVMGGIKERHIPELLEKGARLIAMVTEITQADDVAKRVAQLRKYWTDKK